MRHKDTARRARTETTAACIDTLNRARIESQLTAMKCQDTNFLAALDSLSRTRSIIDGKIIAPNRGGARGMHGFIAEVAEVGIGNARNLLVGLPADYEWVNNNEPFSPGGPLDWRGSARWCGKDWAGWGWCARGPVRDSVF